MSRFSGIYIIGGKKFQFQEQQNYSAGGPHLQRVSQTEGAEHFLQQTERHGRSVIQRRGRVPGKFGDKFRATDENIP